MLFFMYKIYMYIHRLNNFIKSKIFFSKLDAIKVRSENKCLLFRANYPAYDSSPFVEKSRPVEFALRRNTC